MERRRWLTRRNLLIAFAAWVVLSSAQVTWRWGLDGLVMHLLFVLIVGGVYGGFGWAVVRYNRKHFGRAGPPPGRPSACVACEYPLDAAMERCPECGRPVETVVVKGPQGGNAERRVVVKGFEKS
jgi:hypothetical protein